MNLHHGRKRREGGLWEGSEEQVLECHKLYHLRLAAGAAPGSPKLAQAQGALPSCLPSSSPLLSL